MNIYITGFMGSGKTTVGRKLSRLMGRRFVDLDAAIERRSGRSVAEIFSRGEETFRRLESAALRRAAGRRNLVVALGGGTLLDASNRRLVDRSGTLIWLSCAAAALKRRLKRSKNRPLLNGKKNLSRLLAERRGGYARAAFRLSTAARSPARSARLVARKLP